VVSPSRVRMAGVLKAERRRLEVITPQHNQFRAVAPWYDLLMADVPYDMWLRYVLSLYHLHRPDTARPGPVNVLDLACGTGSMAIRFARMGCSVVGVDISDQMVRVAEERAATQNLRVDFLTADAADVDLPSGHFDLCVSLFDSLNYITEPLRLQSAFVRVARALDRDGVFVFDMNTAYALRNRFFDQEDLRAASAIRYRWRSSFDEDSRLCTIHMDFWTGPEGRHEEMFVEVHVQRAYESQEVETMLNAAGFGRVSAYHAYTFDRCTETTDRAYYVATKEPV